MTKEKTETKRKQESGNGRAEKGEEKKGKARNEKGEEKKKQESGNR